MSDGVDPVQVLENRMDAHRTKMDNLESELEAERQRRRELEAKLEEGEQWRNQIERELAELDARTDLLDLVEAADNVDGRQRSVALLQHLKRQAESSNDSAAVDREAAESALHHPDVDRTTIYDDMRRAARLVGDEAVCRYDEGKLRLDLTALPDGVDLSQHASEVIA